MTHLNSFNPLTPHASVARNQAKSSAPKPNFPQKGKTEILEAAAVKDDAGVHRRQRRHLAKLEKLNHEVGSLGIRPLLRDSHD